MLIWKSLTICLQTDSKRVREGIKAGDAFLSLGQVPHVLKIGVQMVPGPLGGNPILHPHGARWCSKFLWRARSFSNGGASSIKLRGE